MLLVLDNFEQVLAAAPVRRRAAGGCPGPDAPGHQPRAARRARRAGFAVPPLALPDARPATMRRLSDGPGRALFVERARRVRPTSPSPTTNAARSPRSARAWTACRWRRAGGRAGPAADTGGDAPRLDRRLALLRPSRRATCPTRQRTLRDAIAWSYDLLDDGRAALFRASRVRRRLHAGAAEAVCDADGDLDVVDGARVAR